MSPVQQFTVEILLNSCIATGVYELELAPHGAMLEAKPGQFVEVAVDASLEPLLRRPISICRVKRDGRWSLIYRVHGRGTHRLATIKAGSLLDVIGPLGRGFSLPNTNLNGPAVLVGGGVGTPPLVFLAQQLKAAGVAVQALLGFASANAIICTDQLESIDVPVQVATDDGSFGFHGFVTSLLEQQQPAVVYTCGPLGMLAAVSRLCISRNIPCQVSLEERMGCGVGACLSCVCKTRSQGAADWHWQRVCKEGPVFSATEVAFDAMR